MFVYLKISKFQNSFYVGLFFRSVLKAQAPELRLKEDYSIQCRTCSTILGRKDSDYKLFYLIFQ